MAFDLKEIVTARLWECFANFFGASMNRLNSAQSNFYATDSRHEPSERRPSHETRSASFKQTKRKEHMNRTILTLACALIAPLAFAQTSTTTKETKTTEPGLTTTNTTTTTTEGTVTTFAPGETIVVKTTAVDPISYVLGKTVHYVNKAGREIEAAMIKPGTRVHVHYDNTGDSRVVNRIVVDDD